MPNPFQLTKLTQVHLQRLQSLGCHGQGAFQRTFLHVLHGTGLHGRGLVYQNFDFMYGYVPNRCPFLPLKWPFWHQKRAPHFELEINEYVVTFGLPLKLGPKLLGLGISATKKWQIYGLNYHELRFPFPSNSIPQNQTPSPSPSRRYVESPGSFQTPLGIVHSVVTLGRLTSKEGKHG